MVATLRAAFGRHVGEPSWTSFVTRLSAASPRFARMWAMHEVARPGIRMKLFKHSAVGLIRVTSTSVALAAPPEARVVVYTPMDDESRGRIEWLLAHPEAVHCPVHGKRSRGEATQTPECARPSKQTRTAALRARAGGPEGDDPRLPRPRM